jgi:DNA-binding NarL/FixJ family response regulator
MKIIIVDDDIMVLRSLKTIIETSEEIEVVAIGNSGEEAIELYKKYVPDVLLMDIRMDKMTGIDAAKDIITSFPEAKILFLTTFADDEYVISALKIGAKGYILKQHYECIVPALKAVSIGQSVFGSEIVAKLPAILKESSSKKDFHEFGISEKEFEIIKFVSNGLSNKEIASILFLSEGTVRNYISTILEKISLRDRTQLAIFYYNNLNI